MRKIGSDHRGPYHRGMRRTRSVALLVAATLAVAAPAACTAGGDSGAGGGAASDPRSGGQGVFGPDGAPPSTDAPPPPTDSAGIPAATAPGGSAVPLPPTSPPEALLAAVAAYDSAPGSPSAAPALQFTVHFPTTGSPYASLQTQDPADPAHVDERAWRSGAVEAPEAVRVVGPGPLEPRLFLMSQIRWPAVADALAGAPALVEGRLGATLENSTGVTHLIATSDLPFSPNTVVRIYVDGGDRSLGGYVELLADGTLHEVQA